MSAAGDSPGLKGPTPRERTGADPRRRRGATVQGGSRERGGDMVRPCRKFPVTGPRRIARALAWAAALAAHPAAADVTLANAWLRPAAAGAAEVPVYVDIRSTEALELVGARSPAARGAELVLVDPPDPDPTARQVP